jgi:hypothetical protein
LDVSFNLSYSNGDTSCICRRKNKGKKHPTGRVEAGILRKAHINKFFIKITMEYI